VAISANGKMVFEDETWQELHQAVKEALKVLKRE
jgi:hypothetical protein